MRSLFGRGEGAPARLDLHQRPETLHFAVEIPEGSGGTFTKALRGLPDPLAGTIGPDRRVPITDLATRMATALGVPSLGPGPSPSR
ncbi:hypothetical protein DQ384_29550 [Sphaerisporangium album]|uniref:Uncharacterized protein n=1 Tax=Sphaerisporangium album TaxID=509200 RepID=A0A367F884_9ACTN|nr:hypothetical protein [Sphaerisporangium album]RCG26576.1 hypothetical protein DQ384_29550 [Sphaerisporangium album]